jgi:hypothetical protein
MGRLGRPSASWRLAAGGSVAVLLATLLSANVLAASNKPFSVSGTPLTINAGDNPGIQIVVKDLTKTQQLGSLEIALSSGFTFSGTPVATVTSQDPNASPSVGLVNPSMLQAQGLNLQPGESATITITDVVAPGCTPLQWTFTAQQANQWTSGNGANYLTLNTAQPTSAGQSCALSFAVSPAVQPADAGANQTITNTPLTPSGTGVVPVTVQVINANTQVAIPVVTNVTLSLNTVRLDDAGGTAALTGSALCAGSTATPCVTTDATGKATFDASVNVGGTFTLTATSSNSAIAPATSTSFRIWGGAAACDTSGCAALNVGASNGESLNVTGYTQGAVGASFDIFNADTKQFDCSASQYGGVAAIPNTQAVTWTTYNPAASGSKTTEIFIPDTLLTQSNVDPLLAVHYMVCMSAPYQFPVAWTPASLTNGAGGLAQSDSLVSGIMGGTWYRGLLPDCQDVGGDTLGPCIASRVHGSLNGVSGLTVTVDAVAGDPFGR